MEQQGLSVFRWPFNSEVFREAWTRSGGMRALSSEDSHERHSLLPPPPSRGPGLPPAASLSGSGLRTEHERGQAEARLVKVADVLPVRTSMDTLVTWFEL